MHYGPGTDTCYTLVNILSLTFFTTLIYVYFNLISLFPPLLFAKSVAEIIFIFLLGRILEASFRKRSVFSDLKKFLGTRNLYSENVCLLWVKLYLWERYRPSGIILKDFQGFRNFSSYLGGKKSENVFSIANFFTNFYLYWTIIAVIIFYTPPYEPTFFPLPPRFYHIFSGREKISLLTNRTNRI